MGIIPESEPLHLVEAALERYGSTITSRKRDAFMARCPAHKDGNPSLSVTRGDDGRALLHCFAGCTTEDICHELGIRTAELFAREHREPAATHTYRPNVTRQTAEPIPFAMRMDGNHTVYEYIDDTGEIAHENERIPQPDGTKTFKAYSYRNGQRVLGLQGRAQIPYGLPEMLADTVSVIHVTEGEKDTTTLRKHGLLAVSISKGALKHPRLAEWFRGRHIVIHVDNDDPGRIHASRVAETLFPHVTTVRMVEYTELPEKGDVTDWLEGDDANH